jgi:hypothetical protein
MMLAPNSAVIVPRHAFSAEQEYADFRDYARSMVKQTR